MRRTAALLTVIAVIAGTSVIAPAAVATVDSTSITWTVDHKKKTITVAAHLEIYLGPCAPTARESGSSMGDPGRSSRDCSVTAEAIGQEIKADIEGVWNGHNYKCYRLIFNVDVTVGTSRFTVDGNRVGVLIDRSIVPIRSHVRPQISDTPTLLIDRWQSNDPSDRVNPSNGFAYPTSWAYPTNLPHIYAHEFGHLLGLHDTYVEGTWQPKPGAPEDVMVTSRTDFIDQSTINRAVERNRDRLRDTKGRPVELEDLTCERQFRLFFSSADRDYEASHLRDSNTPPPCSNAPFTFSTSQDVTAISEPEDVYLIESADAGPLGYRLVALFDLLTVQNGLSGAGNRGKAAGMFDLKIAVEVSRFHSRPATGAVPDVFDVRSGVCSEDGTSQTPRPDCGTRTYDSWLAMDSDGGGFASPINSSLPAMMRSAGYSEPRLSALYRNCPGHQVPWPGGFTRDPSSVVLKPKMPALAELNDLWDSWALEGKNVSLDIEGSASLDYNRPGALTADRFNWTLTFCPLNPEGETPEFCP